MDMFYGTYTLNVDSTGRFVLPVEFRNRLGNSCVITKGTGCLWLMTSQMSEDIKVQLESMAKGQLASMFNSKVSVIARHIFSGMSTLVPEADRNSRITLSREQRRYAKIDKSLVLCGVGNYIEIWNPAELDINNAKVENSEELFDIADLLFNPKENELP